MAGDREVSRSQRVTASARLRIISGVARGLGDGVGAGRARDAVGDPTPRRRHSPAGSHTPLEKSIVVPADFANSGLKMHLFQRGVSTLRAWLRGRLG